MSLFLIAQVGRAYKNDGKHFALLSLARKRMLVRFGRSLTHSLMKFCLFERRGARMNYRLLLEKVRRSRVSSVPQVSTRIRSVRGNPSLPGAAA